MIKYKILRILLFLLTLSFIPLFLNIAEVTRLRRPDLFLPILISALLISCYFVIMLLICMYTHGKKCKLFEQNNHRYLS